MRASKVQNFSDVTVIGSGPVALASLRPLLRQGLKVRVLDGGLQLEGDFQAELDLVRSSTKIPHSFATRIRDAMQATSKGVEFKLTYGSDFPYRSADLQVHPNSTNIGQVTPSLALGGYSNVWGSAILPYPKSEVSDWPVEYETLVQSYKAVTENLRIKPTGEGLSEVFPEISGAEFDLPPSVQAQRIARKFSRNREWLQRRGYSFGPAQLAFRPKLGGAYAVQDNCVACGLCMYGCPYELIYSSKHTLIELQQAFPGQIEYCSGIMVESLEERDDRVMIYGRNLKDDQVCFFESPRVLLAAGAIASTGILLRTFKEYSRTLSMKASEYFMLPMLGPRYGGNLDVPEQHTLAQLFCEVVDASISEHLIHLQIYTYNDLYKKGLEALAGRAVRFASPLLRRLHVVQGYLHSGDSSQIAIGLHNANDQRLVLCGESSTQAKRKISKLTRKLLWAAPRTGLVPLLPMLSVGKPGDGRHVGGTFPMTNEFQEFSTDTLGRPRGRDRSLRRVHLIDSANFPTVPAPTITLTAMANAHRIATAVAESVEQVWLKAEG